MTSYRPLSQFTLGCSIRVLYFWWFRRTDVTPPIPSFTLDQLRSNTLLLPGPYLAGGQGGQLPPLGKLNVDFFNEVFVFDGIFLVAILVQNLKKTG